jgi:PAS domain S-box-containing protein
MSTSSYVFESLLPSFPVDVAALHHAAAVAQKPVERSDRRFIVNQPAHLSIPDAPGQIWEARIRDISRRGMLFITEQTIPARSRVSIEWNGRHLLGTVRYQEADGSQYRLGVELLTSWDSLVSDVLAKQAEELRASNATLERQTAILKQQADLLDQTHDTISVTTMAGSIRSWNLGAERMYGWTKAEAIGQNIHAMLKTVFPAEPHQVQQALLAHGRWEGEFEQARKDGSRIIVASRWALQRNTLGEPVAIMAINSDITAQKQAGQELIAFAAELKRANRELGAALELAQEASQAKSRFLASVSHELRTPLNGIIGFSQMLHDERLGPLTSDQKEGLADVLHCSQHLLVLIGQVLDLSKIEAGKMEFHYERVCLKNFVQEAIGSLGILAASKNIQVVIRVAPSLDWIQADPAKLRQVLFNYFSNALKFTPDGGVVSVDVDPESGNRYRLTVTDTGIGISAEDLPRLFSEFGQLGSSHQAKPGTGLGLAITKRTVEAQGGQVGVESVPGQGSRFWAVLPSFC